MKKDLMQNTLDELAQKAIAICNNPRVFQMRGRVLGCDLYTIDNEDIKAHIDDVVSQGLDILECERRTVIAIHSKAIDHGVERLLNSQALMSINRISCMNAEYVQEVLLSKNKLPKEIIDAELELLRMAYSQSFSKLVTGEHRNLRNFSVQADIISRAWYEANVLSNDYSPNAHWRISMVKHLMHLYYMENDATYEHIQTMSRIDMRKYHENAIHMKMSMKERKKLYASWADSITALGDVSPNTTEVTFSPDSMRDFHAKI